MNLKREEVAKRLPVIDDEVISALNFSLDKNQDASHDKWLKVSPNTLLSLKLITHPIWEEAYSPRNFKEVSEDATAGITFSFYWNDGFLCWER